MENINRKALYKRLCTVFRTKLLLKSNRYDIILKNHNGEKTMTDSLEAKKLLIIRIMQILEYYSDVNHPLTQEDIINKLYEDYGIEAERKAIGRNIALLQDMFERESMNKTATAIVIESDKRKGTFLDKRLFEDSELRLLIDGVLASKHISEKYSKDLIEKLSSLSNKYFKSNVKHVYSVKDWDKTENKALFWNIEVIDEAIEKCRQITFDYNKYGADKKLYKTSSHTASPYQLILHNQHYYLVFLSEKWKNLGHFRLDKITNIDITEKPLTPLRSLKGYESGLDYRKYASSLPYMFTDKVERITFICDECVVDQVVDWFGKNITLNARGNGKYEAVVSASPNAMEYWAMQYLNYVEIKSPTELRERIKQNLKTAEEKYK